MKNNKVIRVLLLFFILASTISVFAQKPLLCGGYKIDLRALQKAKEFEKQNMLKKPQAGLPVLIRVYFHIFTYSDGTNPVATTAQIESEFNTLVTSYSPNNICFINTGLNYIPNDGLDTNFVAGVDDPAQFNPYLVSNCINIFYLNNIKGNNNACNGCGIGGTSLMIPNTFCLIASGNIGAHQTIAHEVGHCIGLLHTFETVAGLENIDGSNSNEAGDQIVDTRADPYRFVTDTTCFKVTNCMFSGSCVDSKGQNNWSPPYTNLMSYWGSPACFPLQELTPDQFIRIRSYLVSNDRLKTVISDANLILGPGISISSGFNMVSAIYSLYTSGSVVFSGGVVATIGAGSIYLQDGFKATPTTGKIVIMPKPCD